MAGVELIDSKAGPLSAVLDLGSKERKLEVGPAVCLSPVLAFHRAAAALLPWIAGSLRAAVMTSTSINLPVCQW